MTVGMIDPIFLLIWLVSLAECRVSFEKSEVLDDVDLRGTATASFRCSAGCRVYSPAKNDKIVIVDSTGKEYETLQFLSQLKMGQNYPLTSGNYQLKNKGPANPSFVFYAVETGASSYGTPVAYVSATSNVTLAPTEASLVTVMSSSGVIHIAKFQGDYSDAFPSVYTTGFDAVTDKTCRPVYNAINAYYMYNVGFPINSPIATINFKKKTSGRLVIVSGETNWITSMGINATASFNNYFGYVGCGSVGDALYSLSLPIRPYFDHTFSNTQDNGIVAVIDGEFSIAKAADAATLTVNDDSQELYGKDQKLYRTEEGRTITIGVKWASKESNAKDRFALQIDMIPADLLTAQSSTTRGVVVEPTTSSVRNQGLYCALLAISVLLMIY